MKKSVEVLSRSRSGMFVKGVSGNPGGRPRSGFGEFIRGQTNDGKELVERVLGIMRMSNDDRMVLYAVDWLSNRGWGRPERLQIIYNGIGRRDNEIVIEESGNNHD